MENYTIDFYNNDEFTASYGVLATSMEMAIESACQALYLDGCPATYYVVFSQDLNETTEGWL